MYLTQCFSMWWFRWDVQELVSALLPQQWSCCQLLTLWGVLTALSWVQSCFLFLTAHKWPPTAPWVVSRFAVTIFFTGSIKQTGMWQLNHLGCSKVFLCCSSRPDWRLVLPVNGTAHPALPACRRACGVCIHALKPNSFSQAGSDGVSWYKENQIDFHNRTAITEAHDWNCSRLRWWDILDSLKEPECNLFFPF